MTAPVRLLQPLFPGLVLYLPFWEGAGTFAEDVSPFRNHGAITGASWVDGVIGKALSFDGTNDYVLVENNYLNDAKTLSFWVKADASWSDHILISKQNGAASGYIQYWVGQLSFYAPGNVVTVNWGTPTVDVWHHLVLVVTGTQHFAYLDGVLVSVETSALTLFVGNTYVQLGTYDHGSYWFDGSLDEVRVYNRALTPSEVWEEYYRGARQNY